MDGIKETVREGKTVKLPKPEKTSPAGSVAGNKPDKPKEPLPGGSVAGNKPK